MTVLQKSKISFVLKALTSPNDKKTITLLVFLRLSQGPLPSNSNFKRP